MISSQYPPVTPRTEIQPTIVQRNREAALRRFNRLYVYFPIAGMGILTLLVMGWLLWQNIVSGWFIESSLAENRAFASGLADTLFFVFTLPCALLCPALPIGFFAGIFYARKQGVAPIQRLQKLLWRLHNLLTKIHDQLDQLTSKAAALLIRLHSNYSRWQAFAKRLRPSPSTQTDKSSQKRNVP